MWCDASGSFLPKCRSNRNGVWDRFSAGPYSFLSTATDLVYPESYPDLWSGIVNSVYGADPKGLVHDTRAWGCPDLVRIGCEATQKIGAKAVISFSNEVVMRLIVGELERRGIPTHGAMWDS
ncbi:hypothetical protein NUU61_006786 [Penicillium alfredii]|uniref:Uncharacterized protein n=1 Tax=Penicillium alfredii TaxID=1506179 RepID=A0A9W9F1T7_9EURO|nr:uncharacterized protein NUU61_006786 [Penicillium alfredii]KAJ5091916.1 hypothetical protein NUU61_006786 [Penicillium alfredii]